MLSKSQRDELRRYANMGDNEPCVHMRSSALNHLRKAGPTAIPALLDAADELERLREGLNGLLAQMERAESELEHPGRYAAARCISGRDVKALLNNGGDDGSK